MSAVMKKDFDQCQLAYDNREPPEPSDSEVMADKIADNGRNSIISHYKNGLYPQGFMDLLTVATDDEIMRLIWLVIDDPVIGTLIERLADDQADMDKKWFLGLSEDDKRQVIIL